MGRGRVSVEFIQKEKSRKISLQTRKIGLMTKVEELSILCDVDACVILYAPNFEGQGYDEPETWPKDTKELQRILQRYYNTTIDRRLKTYNVQEYFKERMKKVEFEISKVRKEKFKMKYQTWDESFNFLEDEQLRLFASILDFKLDACNLKMNMLKGDLRGKSIALETNKIDNLNSSPYLDSNPSSYFNLPQNNMSQAHIYPPLMNINDKNPLGFWPLISGQSSQPSHMVSTAQSSQPSPMVSSAQSFYHVESYPCKQIDGNWTHHVDGNVTYHHPKIDMKKDEAENDKILPPYYYNRNGMIMQSYPIAMSTLPSQNLSNLSHEHLNNGSYDKDVLHTQMFNYMDGRK
ncbi:agamous-like MADS-box protein AGL82 [Medicago truncatula]|uniref:MADS-box transcription factor family protein n=2 Tax=Medicago truncatula TaxID=3880 RepID=G7KHI3_MEDTR|nr:agamous-like MADS-box protein AGL82 [Medicago truncatula]AES74395.1 MADS-box transcription factor family protein [Medicago truncatula]